MKNNLDYYPHRTDSHRHPKFKMLRTIYGFDGWAYEGRFWALNNFIAESADCKLDLSKKRNMGVIALELGLSLEEFERYLSVLKSQDVELIFEIEPNVFTTKKIVDTLSNTKMEREKARQRKEKTTIPKSSPELLGSSPELPHSSAEPDKILEETKLEETKGKESTTSSISSLYDTGANDVPENTSAAANIFEINQGEFKEIIPNFQNISEVKKCIENLFRSFALNFNTNEKADIEPVLNFLKERSESMSLEVVWSVITESFVALKQANNTKTSYLLGILRRKISEKTTEIAKNHKNSHSTQNLAQKRAEEQKRADEERLKTAELLTGYKDFINKNPNLFDENELKEIDKLISEERFISLSNIITPKMELVAL